MEGLAITPDGTTLAGIMQAPLLQDGSTQVRIVTIDIASGATKQFGYHLTSSSGVSEIVALNNPAFLVDKRDGNGLGDGTAAGVKQLFKIDIAGASDIASRRLAVWFRLAGLDRLCQKTRLSLVYCCTLNGAYSAPLRGQLQGATARE